MLKGKEVDKPLFEWYFVWVFVPFFMHFLGRIVVWTLVLYCISIGSQLSERVGNCMILWRFENSTLDHNRGKQHNHNKMITTL